MPALKTTIIAILAASTAVALPAAQATSTATVVAPMHLEVSCGCWNLCTLEALGDSSITGCDAFCDPQFFCDAIDAQLSTAAVAPSITPTFTPTLPTTLAKRRIPIAPTPIPGPTFPEIYFDTKAKRDPKFPENHIPPPFVSEDDNVKRSEDEMSKRKIPWDVTIKGSGGSGGWSVEGSITIHF